MKLFNTFCALLSLSLTLGAQTPKPEKVYPITREMHGVDWYTNQSTLWENEVKKNPKNADAWFNYYRATRYKIMFGDRVGLQEKQAAIIAEAGKKIPDSYQYNLMEWYQGGLDLSRKSYLEKASKISPDSYEVIVEMVTVSEVEGKTADRKKYCEKWLNGEGLSNDLLAYNYNVLMSVEPNGILITHGDNDTYPLWLLQDARNIRPDVTVLNLSLLYIDAYRDLMFKRIGAKSTIAKMEDWFRDKKTDTTFNNEMLKSIFENTAKKPVYFAITVSEEVLKPYENDLYLTGLANRYSLTKMDNMATLRKNYEQFFLTDNLRLTLAVDRSETVMKMMNQNYLLPLVTLRNHYSLCGDMLKKDETETLIKNIARRSDREKEILSCLDK